MNVTAVESTTLATVAYDERTQVIGIRKHILAAAADIRDPSPFARQRLPSQPSLSAVDHSRRADLGWRGIVLRLLPGQPRGQLRPHRLPSL
jgi:hypothetical protein